MSAHQCFALWHRLLGDALRDHGQQWRLPARTEEPETRGDGGMKICPDCHRTHPSSDVRRINRFPRFGVEQPGYQHRLLPGVIFSTREAAWEAGCLEQQRLAPADPMGTGNLLEEL